MSTELILALFRPSPGPSVRAEPLGRETHGRILHGQYQQRPHLQSLPERHAAVFEVV